MKKLLFLVLLVAILGSCSKDRRIYRQLNGSWKVTLYEDVVVSPTANLTYIFSKEKKKKGTGKFIIGSTETDFTYEVLDLQIRLMTKDNSGQTITTLLGVAEYSKTKMVLVNAANGKITNLRAK